MFKKLFRKLGYVSIAEYNDLLCKHKAIEPLVFTEELVQSALTINDLLYCHNMDGRDKIERVINSLILSISKRLTLKQAPLEVVPIYQGVAAELHYMKMEIFRKGKLNADQMKVKQDVRDRELNKIKQLEREKKKKK